jgi:hypothetical protein
MDATFNIPRLYLEWGLSHHEPKAHTWHAGSGVQVFGQPDHGVPFLRARVILLYLSTLVRDEDSEFITGSLDDMLERFGLSWPMENAEKHFLRVIHARFRCGDRCVCAPARCRQLQSVASRIHYCPDTHAFRLVVSRDFFRSAMKGIPLPVSVAQQLSQDDQLAALDLSIWYTERHHWRKFEPVDALGPNGPFAYIKSARKRYRKRKELARLHAAVVRACPTCPFHLDAHDRIVYDPTRAQQAIVMNTAGHANAAIPSESAPPEPAPPAPVVEAPARVAVPAARSERIPPRAPPARVARASRPRPRPVRAPIRKPKPKPLELPPRVLLRPRLPSLSPTATTVPCVPRVPELPELPALPALPELPALPSVPSVPFVDGFALLALGRDPPDSS